MRPAIDKSKVPYFRSVGLSAIFIIALAIRLHPVINSPEKFRFGFGPFGDTHFYHRVAYNLYRGNGFTATDDGRAYGLRKEREGLIYEPTFLRGPVYPFFIYMVYKFLGNERDMESIESWHYNLDKVRMAQCALDATVCLLVFLIVRAIYPSSYFPAFISAVLYCFSFYNIFYTRALLSEPITTFIITCAILSCTMALRNKRRTWFFLTGATFGLLVLSRAEYVLFLFVLAGYIFFIQRISLRIATKNMLIFIFSAFMVIIPWTMRNYLVFKKPIIVSSGTLGYTLYLGTFQSKEHWRAWGNYPKEMFDSKQKKDEIIALDRAYNYYLVLGDKRAKKIDDIFMRLALERIRKHPFKSLKSRVIRIHRLWYQDYIKMYRDREASGIFFIFYFIFGCYAFLSASKEERLLMSPVCLLFIYITLIFLPLYIEPRYGVALMPGIISLAGIGTWKAISRMKKRIQ